MCGREGRREREMKKVPAPHFNYRHDKSRHMQICLSNGMLHTRILGLCILVLFLGCITFVSADQFQWVGSTGPSSNFTYLGDASLFTPTEVQLTLGVADAYFIPSSGRLMYNKPIRVCDSSTKATASFSTSFVFRISSTGNKTYQGDGILFFLGPALSQPPLVRYSPGSFGMFNETVVQKQLVAIEFDTSQESWDPDGNHVGVDVISVVSRKVTSLSSLGIALNQGGNLMAWVDYDGRKKSLQVYLSASSSKPVGKPTLAYRIALCNYLPEEVYVGFSSASHGSVETHTLYSWSFRSSGAGKGI